ncbi:MAG: 16S rRNA (uracil(1498)-N(3))-methyltransferase [Planctomycetes bacterium]|nr:16S rRNA (uracil(1498)-N(3))-methyltransferase [Planctomycetota bacterium]
MTVIRDREPGIQMRTLFVPAPLVAGPLVLGGDEAHHGRTVLRLRAGDEVRLADGDGSEAVARVTEVDRQQLTLDVAQPQSLAPSPAALLTVAVAAPKGDRFTDLVRMLTELGVGAIQPLSCERGEREPNLERARRVAIEALKQCRRSHLPRLGPLVDLPTLAGSGSHLIVLDPDGTSAQPGRPMPTTLIIGPEGGFTATETDAVRQAGARAVRLASPILRIETAAVAAAAVWVAAWESDA